MMGLEDVSDALSFWKRVQFQRSFVIFCWSVEGGRPKKLVVINGVKYNFSEVGPGEISPTRETHDSFVGDE